MSFFDDVRTGPLHLHLPPICHLLRPTTAFMYST